MSTRIALFGGSFDPVHNGHLIVARSLAEQIGLDRVVLLPSRLPPHKLDRALADRGHRTAMVHLAIAGESLFEFSDHDLLCEGPSYTIHTVRHFRDALSTDCALHWIIGADSLHELHTWYRVDELVDACTMVTAARPGSESRDLPELRGMLGEARVKQLLANVVNTPRIDISATDIRRRVEEGKSIRYLVPEAVEQYILDHDLYTEND